MTDKTDRMKARGILRNDTLQAKKMRVNNWLSNSETALPQAMVKVLERL
ncbi:MAG: hypothetical protein LBU43_03760 [Candidatus Accumulibacter sp.]|nr:hypothetical protein [Accumulibacter sp.]